MKAALGLFVAAILLVLAVEEARGQERGGFDPEQVRELTRKYMESLPSAEVKVEGIVLKYKKVPGDPKKVIQEILDERWRGMAGDYSNQIRDTLHSLLEEAGTLKTRREITFKKKKIPPGEYAFGIFMEEGVPSYVGISGKGLEEPVRIPFKSRKGLSKPETLKIKGTIKKKKRWGVTIAFAGHAAKLPPLSLGKVVEKAEKEDPPPKKPGRGKGEEGTPPDPNHP